MTILETTDGIGGVPVRPGGAGRTARVAPLMAMPELLTQFGVELAPLLAEAGLPADILHDPDNRAPVQEAVRLLVRAAEAADCPHLGLLLGERVNPLALGAAGRLLRCAPSVERGLRGLIMNLHLNGEAVVPALAVRRRSASLSITPYAFHPAGAAQLGDVSLAVATNILRFLCGPHWSPTLVTLAHREPQDRRPYDRFFRAPVRFGMEATALHFAPAWLGRQPSAFDRQAARPPGAAFPADAPDLDTVIWTRRAAIACMAQGIVAADGIAAHAGLGKRTLNRRLAERGTSIKEVIAGVRLQVAQQLMRDTDLTLADVAVTTCYSDVAAFSRAFRAKVGTSPALWRKAAGGKA